MRARQVALVLGFVMLLCTAGGALAADGDEGFFVSLEAKFVKPSNLGSGYVIVSPEYGYEPKGVLRSVEMSESFAPEISFGQQRSSGSGWMFSYWSFDDDDADSVTSPEGGSLFDILYHADSAYGYFEGAARAAVDVEATTADLVYFRHIGDGEDFHLTWTLGFRYASYEQALDVDYIYGEGSDMWTVQLGNDTDGFGVVTGLQGSVAVGGSMRLEGGVTYAFLDGSTSATNLQYEEDDLDDPDADVSRDEDRGIAMLELEAALVWQLSDAVDIRLGYVASQWDNVIGFDLFPDDVHEGFVQSDVKDVSWNGFSLGMKYTF